MSEEHVIITCRHCQTQNRLLKDKAIKNVKTTICGQCRKNIFIGDDEPYYDISSGAYEHPLDRSALNALKKVPGTGTVLKMIIKETIERYNRILFMQNYIKVTPMHMPFIHNMVTYATKILDIEEVPQVFVYQDPYPNAFTAGVDNPYIGISTSLIDLLSEEELLGVIAHELGHIQCGHVLYKTAARIIYQVMAVVGSLIGVGRFAFAAIVQALYYWDRCSELSADRAEVIVTKSFTTSIYTTMKLASGSQKIMKMLDMDEFLKQGEEAKKMKEENFFNSLLVTMQSSSTTHPFPVWRAGHLKEWVYDGNYLDILQGKYLKRSEEGDPDKDFREGDFKKSDDEPTLIDSFKKLLGLD